MGSWIVAARCGLLAAALGVPWALAAAAENASVPGEVTVPHPTLQNLSVEWAFAGDANANAVVQVRVRRAGSTGWVDSLPLRRVAAGSSSGFSWATRHSGSVFDLEPGTAYEIELSLVDPDGGSVQRVVRASTRTVPAPMPGARVKPATPATLMAVMASVVPGDIVELAPGRYPGFEWTRDGLPGKPVVLRAAPQGGAVIEGELGVFGRRHVQLSGLEVHGRIRANGSSHLAVTRCQVQARAGVLAGDGIVMYRRGEDAYIADNVITGTVSWRESALGAHGENVGEGIAVTGPGHVIQNNRVTGFRDAISFMEGSEAVDQFSLDVLNNDIDVAADDGIEADFCFHNCRIMRNRVNNSFIALSAQPSLGGPTWFVRNVVHNTLHVAFKLYRGSYGAVLLHNTVLKFGDALAVYTGEPVGALFSRNNLILGAGPGGTYARYETGRGAVLALPVLVMATADMDHDALGSEGGLFQGKVGPVEFGSLAALRERAGMKHAVQVDTRVFASRPAIPDKPLTRYPMPDLRLAPGGAAVDMGAKLPGINSDFRGDAPDAGAYELGAAMPHVGPRGPGA